MTPEERKAKRPIWNKTYIEKHPERYQAKLDKQVERFKSRYHTDPEYRERQKQLARDYANANRDKIRARRSTPEARLRDRELRLLNIEHRRSLEVQYKFGLTAAEYREMRESQRDCCAICGKKETDVATRWGHTVPKRLSVDHCHATGRVRGLLCSACNLGLGYFKDNPALMETAIAYLRR